MWDVAVWESGDREGYVPRYPKRKPRQTDRSEHVFLNTRRTHSHSKNLFPAENQLTILLVLHSLNHHLLETNMAAPKVDPVENRRRMEAGELYYCFTPELTAERRRAFLAYTRFNKADDVSRREGLELLKEYAHPSSLRSPYYFLLPIPGR